MTATLQPQAIRTQTGPIIGAGQLGNIYATATGLPNVRGAFGAWGQPLTLGIITKALVDYRVDESNIRYIQTRGVLQPFKSRDLMLKPEGQRAWAWKQLHLQVGLTLKMDDEILVNKILYRVMGQKDYAAYGYVQYEIVQAFQNGRLPTV